MLSDFFAEFHKFYLENIDNASDSIPRLKNIEGVRNKIIAISEKTMDIVGHVIDFRIEMQNKILGPILGKSIPQRELGDDSVKVLSLK
ncbi:MAG: hypothetical protein A2Z08_04955 [Deltaproteobacteria bacterium RBG_16_54_11]|nr:MAG: hypothetical protein A2Z08_04955 [Deltaproteobacteria bacterium RBG_16_54_11]